jgi:hypothetical protein
MERVWSDDRNAMRKFVLVTLGCIRDHSHPAENYDIWLLRGLSADSFPLHLVAVDNTRKSPADSCHLFHF